MNQLIITRQDFFYLFNNDPAETVSDKADWQARARVFRSILLKVLQQFLADLLGRFNRCIDKPVGVVGKAKDSRFLECLRQKLSQQMYLPWGILRMRMAFPGTLGMGTQAVDSNNPIMSASS